MNGSYLRSIMALYELAIDCQLTEVEINTIYKLCVQKGYITEQCYICHKSTEGIFEVISATKGKKCYGVWVNGIELEPTHYITHFQRPLGMKKYYHFAVTDKEGSVIFDPIPNSKTIQFGTIKRIIGFYVKLEENDE